MQTFLDALPLAKEKLCDKHGDPPQLLLHAIAALGADNGLVWSAILIGEALAGAGGDSLPAAANP